MIPHKNVFVMTAAFISIMLLIVARHHPPSRRKIKQIWHGRVYWESNTTMLRRPALNVSEAPSNVPSNNIKEPTARFQRVMTRVQRVMTRVQRVTLQFQKYK